MHSLVETQPGTPRDQLVNRDRSGLSRLGVQGDDGSLRASDVLLRITSRDAARDARHAELRDLIARRADLTRQLGSQQPIQSTNEEANRHIRRAKLAATRIAELEAQKHAYLERVAQSRNESTTIRKQVVALVDSQTEDIGVVQPELPEGTLELGECKAKASRVAAELTQARATRSAWARLSAVLLVSDELNARMSVELAWIRETQSLLSNFSTGTARGDSHCATQPSWNAVDETQQQITSMQANIEKLRCQSLSLPSLELANVGDGLTEAQLTTKNSAVVAMRQALDDARGDLAARPSRATNGLDMLEQQAINLSVALACARSATEGDTDPLRDALQARRAARSLQRVLEQRKDELALALSEKQLMMASLSAARAAWLNTQRENEKRLDALRDQLYCSP